MKTLIIERLERAGCNNGQYPRWVLVDVDTKKITGGKTCGCRRGCANTDDLSDIKEDIKLVYFESDEFDILSTRCQDD